MLIEPIGGLIGTDLLADNLRIDVMPKCGLKGLDALLSWCDGGASEKEADLLEKTVASGQTLFDGFAKRFLLSLEEVATRGLIFQFDRVALNTTDLRGYVDAAKSYERHFSQGRVAFVTQVPLANRDTAPNRVLATALMLLTQSQASLSLDTWKRSCEMSADFARIVPIAPQLALEIAINALAERPFDAERAYYYSALAQAMPILEAASRLEIGVIEVMDVPLRLNMPSVFEDAIRSVTAHALKALSARKGERENLYTGRGSTLVVEGEPDIVVRPLNAPPRVSCIIDAKYKDSPSPGDHYQILSYISSFKSPLGILVAVNEHSMNDNVDWGETESGARVAVYRMSALDMRNALHRYGTWIAEVVQRVA